MVQENVNMSSGKHEERSRHHEEHLTFAADPGTEIRHTAQTERDVPLREKLLLSLSSWWSRSRGMMLVLLAEMFGALMAATTRLLETGREGGKSGMHPFQVISTSKTTRRSSKHSIFVEVETGD